MQSASRQVIKQAAATKVNAKFAPLILSVHANLSVQKFP